MGSWDRAQALAEQSVAADPPSGAQQDTANDLLAAVQTLLAQWIGGGTYTDRSTTITTGGTSKQIIASSATPRRVYIQNPDTATETLYVNYGAAATIPPTNSISLLPGGSDERVTSQSVNANASTTAHVVICKESN